MMSVCHYGSGTRSGTITRTVVLLTGGELCHSYNLLGAIKLQVTFAAAVVGVLILKAAE